MDAANKLQPMVVDKDREEKLLFAARLNEMLDEAGVEPIGKGRQKILRKEFGVSEEAARKWLAGESMPHTKRIPLIAKKFNRMGEWLLTGIGEKHSAPEPNSGSEPAGEAPPAPKIESNISPGPAIRGEVPLISLVQAGAWKSIHLWPPDDVKMIPTTKKLGPRAFAVRIEGDSMVGPPGTKDSFPDGYIIICDPDVVARNKSYVVVRLNGADEAIFKQLVIDGPNRFLKPLNPRYDIIDLRGMEYEICAVARQLVQEFD